MNRRSQTLIVFAVLLGIAVVGRLLSTELGWWNFTPVAAVGLFAGFFFASGWMAAFLSVGALTISNMFLGGYGNPGVAATVYAAMLFPIGLRSILRSELTAPRVLGCAMLSSVVFFVSTNFAHWFFTMPHTLDNLTIAFVSAVPFFRGTLAGDLCFSALLFGGYVWGLLGQQRLIPARALR
ncbi:MAG TPA: DUF6580 family putative transport protein [Pirellulales bacterium]|jgi:hypothetical protein|nr:DUF6580 family putative transport protein [Pirellulales bacterium]